MLDTTRVEVRVEAAFVVDFRDQVVTSMASCARALQRAIETDELDDLDAAFATLAELRGVLVQLPVPPVFADAPADRGAQLHLESARPRQVAGACDVFVTGNVGVLQMVAAAGVERHAVDAGLVEQEAAVREHAERVIYFSDMRAFLARAAGADRPRPRLELVEAS